MDCLERERFFYTSIDLNIPISGNVSASEFKIG